MDFRFPTDKIFPSEERWQILKSWLRGLFLEDWITKTMALVITFALWFGVTGQRAPTTVVMRGVHLSFRLPSETEISNQPVDEVEITVTGDKNRVDRLNPREMAVVVDLTGYKPGDLVVQLKPETVNLELPGGVRLDNIEPNKIALRVEPRIEKSIEVKPVFTGSLPEGFELYNTTVAPPRIRVRGAESHVNALERIPTEKINLENLKGDAVIRQITVDLLDQKVTVLDAVVDVILQIGEERTEKTFSAVAVREINGARAMPETASVTLYGTRAILDNLQPENLLIELQTESDGSITPRLVLPPSAEGKLEMRSLKPAGFSIVK
jgi:YbbR domain-containing protein